MSNLHQAYSSPLEEEFTRQSTNNTIRELPTVDRILARLTAAILLLDHTWHVTYLSQQSDPLLAQTGDALLGKTLWEVFPAMADSAFFRSQDDALASSLAVHYEFFHPASHKWFEVHILPVPDGWTISVHAVTQRKQAEEALANAAAIVASSEDAIFSKTLSGTVLSWNRGAERLYGYTAREIIGQSAQTLIPADRQQEFADIIRLIQAGEHIEHFESVRVCKDGKHVEVSITISPVQDPAGQIIGASTIARDITERKKLESQLRLSEVLLRAITEQSSDAILLMNSQGIIQYSSPNSQSLLGYTPEEMVGRNAFELVHPDDRDRFIAARGNMLTFGKAKIVDYRALHKNGTYRWIESNGMNLMDEPGVHAIVGTYRDITERRQLQEQISLSERQLEAIIEGSPACIYVKDIYGRYTRINQQVADLNHLTKEQMLGKTDDDIFPQELAAPLQAHDREVLATGSVQTREVVSRQADGLHTFLSVKFPLFDDSGVPYAVCGISTDITERVLMEQRKDDFISMASHELKTPLTSLLGYTALLRQIVHPESPYKAAHYLARMDVQLTRLSKLIADLLDMARVQADKLVFAEEPIIIANLLRETVELFQPTAPQCRILIEGHATCAVFGDRDRLEQVILNLLNNAVKYSPGAQSVVVSILEIDDEVTISIHDFGIGIAPHHQERIFERFYRVSSDQEKLFPGLGIGLFLCHEIICHHGGRIWVKSDEGLGSTFSFALPWKRI